MPVLSAEYDEAGRLSGIRGADNQPIQMSSDSATRSESVTDLAGYTTEVVYNASGDPIRQIKQIDSADDPQNANFQITLSLYNTTHDLLASSKPFVVGCGDRLTAWPPQYTEAHEPDEQPDPTAHPAAWQQVKVYDSMGRGNPWVVFDALGQPTTYTYNSHGQQTSVTDPAGRTTINGYDRRGLPCFLITC